MLSNSETFSGFSVDDIDRAAEFYGKTLGLEVQTGPRVEPAHGRRQRRVRLPEARPPAGHLHRAQLPGARHRGGGDRPRERGVEFERYEGTEIETDSSGIFRGGGPLIAWFKDPAQNVLAVIEQGSG